MKAKASAQESKYGWRPLRRALALTLTLLLSVVALSPLEAKTAKSGAKKPQSLPKHKDKKHDVGWMTNYNGRSTNELLYDKRFVGLLKSIAPDVKD
ncbi:MAG TPA: hypothetical protein PK671_23595, partial [Candidatus Obscuribacter sp.]|nr:hypothetical protein [Candidatus Obscuribacter sp.]HNG77584.1 hypothetical protein [Candidatus Obscuribacter sp.]HNH76886.1 hypothetical protein [Candidatus Obscuribacter sp.]